jgi:TolB-like protein/class 3 adenylate cyclase
MTRRLAAILAADVVGYSRLMAADEEGTLATLSTYRGVIDGLVGEHQGRVFGSAGDSVIAEFGSAVHAVRCAVAIQRAVHRRNADLGGPQRMELRIGVSLGDIIVENDNLFGDGVNVAARLEEVAEPADICISGAVLDQIQGKVSFPMSGLGKRALKNIPRPVVIYRVDWRTEDAQATGILGGDLSLPDKPSVAVLPFVNMSGDAEQEYFADGITEDIITALSRNRWFFVIARNSTFTYKGRPVDVKQVARELGVRYVLEGSVRKAGNRVRVTGQLIDAESGAHLWAERYDRDLADVFEVQDELTERVVAAIEPELLLMEGRRAAHKSPANLDAYDFFMRGMWHYHQFDPEENRRAEEWMRKAVALDPRLTQGHIGLARVLNGRIWFGWSTDVEADRRSAHAAAQRAVELDGKDPYCHYLIGLASLISDLHQQALAETQRAIDLNPNFALAHMALGWVRVFIGHFAEAVEPLLRCMRLSPNDPLTFLFLYFVALAYYHQREYARAVEFAQRGLALRRVYPLYEILAAGLAQSGRPGEAAEALKEMERLKPADFERMWQITHPYLDPAHLEHLREGLRKAGVPGEVSADQPLRESA